MTARHAPPTAGHERRSQDNSPGSPFKEARLPVPNNLLLTSAVSSKRRV